MRYTVFLDRDGVINKDSSDYVKHPSEFEFIQKSPEAIALLTQHQFELYLITNQSLIGRKMASQETLNAIFDKMNTGVQAAGGEIRDIFFCPHLPDEGCSCRKPGPGMILSAQKKHGLDLERSCMIGDSANDIECAQNAGCSKTILVKTGNGNTALKELQKKGITPDFIAKDLFHAALWLTKKQ